MEKVRKSTWWKNQGFLLISISTIPPPQREGGGQLSLIAEYQAWSLAPPEFTAVAEGMSPRVCFSPKLTSMTLYPYTLKLKRGQTHL